MVFTRRYGHAGFRPIYCDGGPAWLEIQKRLFPLDPKDTEPLSQAYSPEQLEKLLETNANIFFLVFSPGLDAGSENAAAENFQRAAEYLNTQGAEAVACISAGHCLAGAHDGRDMFAQRVGRKTVPSWIPGFRMTCWTSPEWRERVSETVRRALTCGAAGVCFDTVIFGAVPVQLGSDILGPVGCACARCRESFVKETGANGLKSFPPSAGNDELFFKYLDWRTDIVSDAMRHWADAARAERPSATVTARLLHPVQVNTALLFGADFEKLAPTCDTIIAETGNLINFEKAGLTYDGATLDVLTAYAGDTAVAGAPWTAGPHLPLAPPDALWRAAMSEAAACATAPSIRASIFFDAQSFRPKTLAHEDFEEHRQTMSRFWNWIDRTPEVFAAGRPFARTALLHPPRALMIGYHETAPCFFKMYATLTELHVPFRVLPERDIATLPYDDVQLIIVPPGAVTAHGDIDVLKRFALSGKLLFMGTAPDWAPEDNRAALEMSIFSEPAAVTGALRRAWRNARHSGTPAPYFQHRFPAAGGPARALRTPGLFRVPERWKDIFDTVNRLLAVATPGLEIEGPPYLHVREWRANGNAYLHINNLLPGFEGPKMLRLRIPSPVSMKIFTPDRNKVVYTTDRTFTLEVITYAVVVINGRQ
jgi:hypothetical protein